MDQYEREKYIALQLALLDHGIDPAVVFQAMREKLESGCRDVRELARYAIAAGRAARDGRAHDEADED